MPDPPIVLPSNRPADRFYRGGRRITDLRGDAPAKDHEPEDWVASTTHVFGQPGVGETVLPDGTPLRVAVEADPVGWLGEAHVAAFGADTKLLTKLLDAGQRLPVHAHPDGAFAQAHLGHAHGKAEAWVILQRRHRAPRAAPRRGGGGAARARRRPVDRRAARPAAPDRRWRRATRSSCPPASCTRSARASCCSRCRSRRTSRSCSSGTASRSTAPPTGTSGSASTPRCRRCPARRSIRRRSRRSSRAATVSGSVLAPAGGRVLHRRARAGRRRRDAARPGSRSCWSSGRRRARRHRAAPRGDCRRARRRRRGRGHRHGRSARLPPAAP